MRKNKQQLSILLPLIALFMMIGTQLWSQCSVTILPSNNISISCGDSILLSAYGSGTVPVLSTDFNSGSAGPGWGSTGGATFSQPCGSGVDGTPYYWASTSTGTPELTTTSFDVSCGAQVCFDMTYAVQSGASPCEGPDLPDEGVTFEYSTDGGVTWNQIEYWDPNGGYDPVLTTWNNYCFTIPVAASTANTMFRWIQYNSSGTCCDNWGIDNVVIIPGLCGGSWEYDWSNIPGTSNGSQQYVAPMTSTSYSVILTDGTETCYDTVQVNVDQLIADATTSAASLMCPDCADLDAQISNSNAGSIVDDFDPGIDPTMWSTIESGTAGTGCGGMSGNGLHFDGSGTDRYAATVPVNAGTCSSINFCLFLGNSGSGGAPCENVDANENITLEYSTNGGTSWNIITTYLHSSWDNNNAWQCFTVPIPPPAQTPSTMFRWNQAQFSSCAGCDNWSLDNVQISCAPPAFDYAWTPTTGLDDPAIQTPQACPVAPTTYSVTITDPATGCYATDDVFIDVTCSCMFYDFTATVSACEPGNTFTVSGDFSYVENPGTGTIVVEVTNSSGTYTQTFNPPFTNQSVDSYSISGIPADGSPLTVDIYFSDDLACTAQLTDTSPVLPDVTSISGGGIYCPGDVITDIEVEATGVGPWTIDYTLDGAAQSATGATSTISLGNAEGVYSLSLVTDANGCTNTISGLDSIELHPVPQMLNFSGGGTYCADSTPADILAEVNGTSPWTLDYTFNGTAQTINSTDSIINLGNAEGTYDLVFLADANCSGTVSGTETIVVNPLPPVDAGQDFIVCDGQPATLNGSGANSYTWDNNVTDGVAFVPTQTTTYTVTGTDVNGCQDSDDITITVEPLPTVMFYADSLSGCEPMLVNFTNTTAGNLTDCQWTFGDGTTGSGCNQVTHLYEFGGTYDVTLETTSSNGCTNDVTYDDYIYVENNPEASFIPSLYSVINLSPEVIFDNNTTGAVNYVWDFGDGSDFSTQSDPTHSFPDNTTMGYNVTLYAYSPIGCVDSAMTVIQVNEVIIFYIPNTFTPDDDQFNQTFQPVFTAGFDPYDFNLLIYNRWGEIVFESNDASVGWDGTYGGEMVQDGTYTWKIEFRALLNDERFVYTGHLNLIR